MSNPPPAPPGKPKAPAGLLVAKATVDGEREAVEADLGPVRYLATLIDYLDRATLRDQQ